jgi:hypothetical protein
MTCIICVNSVACAACCRSRAVWFSTMRSISPITGGGRVRLDAASRCCR